MTDAFEAIRDRRSVRDYTGRSVSYDKLKMIAYAGLHAPTIEDLRPQSFVLVNDGRKIAEMSDNAHGQSWIQDAGGLIGVVSHDDRIETYRDDVERLAAEHLGAAMQNMLLAAHSLGLGACWVEEYESDPVERLFSDPPDNDLDEDEDASLRAVLVTGYPDSPQEDKPPLQPENHIWFDQFEERLERHRYMRGDYYGELKKIGYNAMKDAGSLGSAYKELWTKLKNAFD